MRPIAWLAVFCCLIASCARWCEEEDAENAATNGATNNATSGSNSMTSAPDCVPTAFPQTVPFGAGDALPFSYDIPAPFGRIDESTGREVAGVIFARRADGSRDDLSHTYRVSREPAVDADPSEWGGAATTVEIGDETLDARLLQGEGHDELRFHVSVDGEDHEVSLRWESPAGCEDARAALRELVTSTLQRNPASSFPD